MRRVLAASAAVALAALGVVVMSAGPATAQVNCTGVQTASPATVTPSSLLPGETLTITGGGFDGDQPLGIGLFNPPMVVGTVASDFNGFYRATVTLPLNTPPGQNEITVFGLGPYDACHQSLGLFTVRALPTPSTVVVTPLPFYPTPLYPAPIYTTPIYPQPITVSPPPSTIVVTQPLARTGSASPVLVAAGLLAMLLGFHVVRVAGPRRSIAG